MRIKLPTTLKLQQTSARTLSRWGKGQVRLIRIAFTQGGHQGHGGATWVARQRTYPWPILRKTGALMRSVFSRMNDGRLMVAAQARHAIFHQKGTKKGLPARPIVVRTAQDMTELKATLKQHLERVIRQGR